MSPGRSKKINGKVLFVKNSKRGTKLIISYWTVEETEDDGEDEYITLVQFVTDVTHKDLVVPACVKCVLFMCFILNTFYRFYVFKTYHNVVQIIYYLV